MTSVAKRGGSEEEDRSRLVNIRQKRARNLARKVKFGDMREE